MARQGKDFIMETERTDPMNDKTTDVAVIGPPRLKYMPLVEERYNVDRSAWKVLVETIYPSAATSAAVVLALGYCKQRELDPFKRPVHIVPMWSSVQGQMIETVWPGISELRTTAHRTGEYAGCDVAEFGPLITKLFEGKASRGKLRGQARSIEVTFPEWARITVYRIVHGVRCPFVGPKVKWEEAYATWSDTDVPNEMWAERPEGQLEKCAEAAALRRAFPEEIGGDLTAEEMAGRKQDEPINAQDITPPPAPPPSSPQIAAPEPEPPPPIEPTEFVTEDGEILTGIDETTMAIDELRALLKHAKDERGINAAADQWLNRMGDLPESVTLAMDAAIEQRTAELKAEAEAAKAAAKADKTPPLKAALAKAQQRPAGKAAAKGVATPTPAPETAPAGQNGGDLPPRESHEALKSRLRSDKLKSAQEVLAVFENYVAPHLAAMTDEERRELGFIKDQRVRLKQMGIGKSK
jgi:phage recombination protein Bet